MHQTLSDCFLSPCKILSTQLVVAFPLIIITIIFKIMVHHLHDANLVRLRLLHRLIVWDIQEYRPHNNIYNIKASKSCSNRTHQKYHSNPISGFMIILYT